MDVKKRTPLERSLTDYLSAVCEVTSVRRGIPLPFGASLLEGGANFALFSRHATKVSLDLFDNPHDASPSRTFELDPLRHKTGDVWHIWIEGIPQGALYAFRVDGPYLPSEGHRFNAKKLLLDPYATAITHLPFWDFHLAYGYDPQNPQKDLIPSHEDDASSMPKCIFTQEDFDWGGEKPLRYPWSKTIIYETHVRGITKNPNSKVAYPGTYRGLIEKIPHLQQLGITAIELMPVHEFNEYFSTAKNPETGEPLNNYWGYEPVSFFAVKASYCSSGCMGQQKLEFKEMVKAFHLAGIEIILDVVFNHTAEGDQLGPSLCFRGIDNSIYYALADDKRYYKNYAGTGNTINANHPVVRDYILDALRYWVVEMHVDGFRFDLASILGRDENGNLQANAPLLERIAEDPILRDVKIIAEAWDLAGAYEVGSFSERRWSEWNGAYRDDVRSFWRGNPGKIGTLAARLSGSADIYAKSGKGPENSINFMTCHDGFTLNDLVSYRQKHNQDNGHDNKDGTDANFSDNYGEEGPTKNSDIEAIRTRQIKNFLLTLLVSRGVPMLLGGDEFRRTQLGNNNAYCQDNEISWYNWSYVETHEEIFRFTKGMNAFRRAYPVLSKEEFYSSTDISWFNPQGNIPDWQNPNEKKLACLIDTTNEKWLFLMFNADINEFTFKLPPLSNEFFWHLIIDTFLETPRNFFTDGQGAYLDNQANYLLKPRSSVMLLGRKKTDIS